MLDVGCSVIDAVRLRSQSGMPRCACARPLFHERRPVRCRAELRLLLERALRRVGAERAELNLGALLAPPCLRPRLGPSPRLGLSVPPVDGSAPPAGPSKRCSLSQVLFRERPKSVSNKAADQPFCIGGGSDDGRDLGVHVRRDVVVRLRRSRPQSSRAPGVLRSLAPTSEGPTPCSPC